MVRSDSFERSRKGSKEPKKVARTKISSSPRTSSPSMHGQFSSSSSSVSQKRDQHPSSKKTQPKSTRKSYQPSASSNHGRSSFKAMESTPKNLSGRNEVRMKGVSVAENPPKPTSVFNDEWGPFGNMSVPGSGGIHAREVYRGSSSAFSSRYTRAGKSVHRHQALPRQQRKRAPQTSSRKENDTTSAVQTA